MAKKSTRKSRWKTRGIDTLIPVKVKHSCGDPTCSHDHHVDDGLSNTETSEASEAPQQGS
jgi:hypothetical protein